MNPDESEDQGGAQVTQEQATIDAIQKATIAIRAYKPPLGQSPPDDIRKSSHTLMHELIRLNKLNVPPADVCPMCPDP